MCIARRSPADASAPSGRLPPQPQRPLRTPRASCWVSRWLADSAYDRGMVRVLAVSDEVSEELYADPAVARDAELILACGDLPFDYLDYLMNALDVPLVFVPGNHDPDVSGYRVARSGLILRAGLPASPPWPAGAACADGRVVDAAGLRLAGLGGCRRYSAGPNQYTDRQQGRRARALARRAAWHKRRDGKQVRHPAHARAATGDRRRRRPPASGFRRAAPCSWPGCSRPCCCTATSRSAARPRPIGGSAARSCAT